MAVRVPRFSPCRWWVKVRWRYRYAYTRAKHYRCLRAIRKIREIRKRWSHMILFCCLIALIGAFVGWEFFAHLSLILFAEQTVDFGFRSWMGD